MTENLNRLDEARQAVNARAQYILKILHGLAAKDLFWNEVAGVFELAYKNPILTTAEILTLEPARTYVGTGGWGCYGPPNSFPPLPQNYPNALQQMWIRDACAQYHAYLGVFGDYEGKPPQSQLDALRKIIEGVIRASADFLTRHPDNIKGHAFERDGTVANNGREYEPDTLAWLILLASDYDSVSGGHLDGLFWKAMRATIQVLNDNLRTFEDGTALTLTPYRPSDDKAALPFNIPVNAFCAVAMEKLVSLAKKYGSSAGIDIAAVERLGRILRLGVTKRGVAKHDSFGNIFVFETNGEKGKDRQDIFMDDAGVPSLLALPYLGFCRADDPLYLATRSFALSNDNEFYFTSTKEGMNNAGIGSPHTQIYSTYAGWGKGIWQMALIAEGLTLDNTDKKTPGEIMRILKMIVESCQSDCNDDAFGCECGNNCEEEQIRKEYPAKGYVRESFEADHPWMYTRGWFAWVNAFFGEWIDTMITHKTPPVGITI